MNYYNENDPKAAAWLRELIQAGLISRGEVDERSICDVQASDLKDFAQCHFFAGIGGWSYALRLAGWPDDRAVWTGSCPCQPFSAAGKRKGVKDARHLWPQFKRLIGECAPAIVFGEQVASADGRQWVFRVRADLERMGRAVGIADLCAASAGAPHIRQRLWFVSVPNSIATERAGRCVDGQRSGLLLHATERSCASGLSDGAAVGRRQELSDTGGCGSGSGEDRRPAGSSLLRTACASSDAASHRCGSGAASPVEGGATNTRRCDGRAGSELHRELSSGPEGCCGSGGLGDSDGTRSFPRESTATSDGHRRTAVSDGGAGGLQHADGAGRGEQRGPVAVSSQFSGAERAGAWSDFDVLAFTDGKARRVEAGTFPLAHGIPARVGLLRGYGNAIVPEVAAQFIQACEEAINLEVLKSCQMAETN